MSELDIVKAVRAKYPTPLGATHGMCLIEIAATIGNGAGLYKKDYGTFVVLRDGTKVSQDIIAYRDGTGYDCLGSGETDATPQWNKIGSLLDDIATRYYAINQSPPPDPPPGPPPSVEYVTRKDFDAAISLVRHDLDTRIEALTQTVTRLAARIEAAHTELARPLVIDGNTDRAGVSILSHYHGSSQLTVRRG
jgi:hypothetical protein